MILNRFKLDDNVAVVTGAGRGLGAAIAEAFAQAGADVLIASRTESQLREVAAKVQAAGRQAEVVVADLSDTEASAALAQKAVDRFGRLDVVVNNVGGTMPKPFLDTTNDDLAEAFSFNVLSGHALLRAAVPHLLKSDNASVINITSTMGRLPGRVPGLLHRKGRAGPLHTHGSNGSKSPHPCQWHSSGLHPHLCT